MLEVVADWLDRKRVNRPLVCDLANGLHPHPPHDLDLRPLEEHDEAVQEPDRVSTFAPTGRGDHLPHFGPLHLRKRPAEALCTARAKPREPFGFQVNELAGERVDATVIDKEADDHESRRYRAGWVRQGAGVPRLIDVAEAHHWLRKQLQPPEGGRRTCGPACFRAGSAVRNQRRGGHPPTRHRVVDRRTQCLLAAARCIPITRAKSALPL